MKSEGTLSGGSPASGSWTSMLETLADSQGTRSDLPVVEGAFVTALLAEASQVWALAHEGWQGLHAHDCPPAGPQVSASYVRQEQELSERARPLVEHAADLVAAARGLVAQAEGGACDRAPVDVVRELIRAVNGLVAPSPSEAMLRAFLRICDDMDGLHRLALKNVVVLLRIAERHDECTRGLRLLPSIAAFVANQPFFSPSPGETAWCAHPAAVVGRLLWLTPTPGCCDE